MFLPGESQGWGSLVGCHLWGCTESDTTVAAATAILPRLGLYAVKTSLNYSWNFHIDMVWKMFFADVFILSCMQELLITSRSYRRVPSLSWASVSSPVNKGGSSSQKIFGSVIAGALARNSTRSSQPEANHGDRKKKRMPSDD